MKTKWVTVIIAFVGLVTVVGLLGQTSPAGTTVDYEKLAQRIVGQCGGIKEGEIVTISGNARDMELLECLAVDVRKQGAFPLLLTGTDRLGRRLIVDVPEKFDSQSPRLDLKMAEIADAQLSIEWGSDPALNADIPVQRLEARSRASIPVSDLLAKRAVRGVSLGNDMYPSQYNAVRFGMTEENLSKLFWGAVNIDYTKLQTLGQTISQRLAQGKEVRITNPNGTDLKLQIAGRPVVVSDGVISAEDIQHGYASSQVYLPAGEVFLAPVSGTAEGKVVIDRIWYYGKEINGLTLTFKAGKLVDMTGKPGFEALKQRYDVAGPGKEDFAYVDVGINPQVTIPAGSKLQNWTVSGMVTVGIGGNLWAGGTNNSAYGLSGYLPGSTLTIDGKALVEAGKLKATEM